jgi:hypothetical protein
VIQLAQRGERVRRQARLARPQKSILHVRLPPCFEAARAFPYKCAA